MLDIQACKGRAEDFGRNLREERLLTANGVGKGRGQPVAGIRYKQALLSVFVHKPSQSIFAIFSIPINGPEKNRPPLRGGCEVEPRGCITLAAAFA